MAITKVEYALWKQLRDDGLLPPRPSLLEIGEANWFGDLSIDVLIGDAQRYCPDNVGYVRSRLSNIANNGKSWKAFEVADLFWRVALGYSSRMALDQEGSPTAVKLDLNCPIAVPAPFDIVSNNGTAEHVFNQHQLFTTIHDACKVGGLMVHDLPLWGWLDHGLFNYHPTFVADLAACNGYEVVRWSASAKGVVYKVSEPSHFAHLPDEITEESALMHVVLRRTSPAPFKPVVQGYYAGRMTKEQRDQWRENVDTATK